VRLLIDTNVFLDQINGASIDPTWAEAIDDADQVYLSVGSMWEIAIKHRKGKLDLRAEPSTVVHAGMERLQLMPLDITPRHVLATSALALHHKDPFDRLFVAQALCERLTIVTSDRNIRRYDVPILGQKARKPKAD